MCITMPSFCGVVDGPSKEACARMPVFGLWSVAPVTEFSKLTASLSSLRTLPAPVAKASTFISVAARAGSKPKGSMPAITWKNRRFSRDRWRIARWYTVCQEEPRSRRRRRLGTDACALRLGFLFELPTGDSNPIGDENVGWGCSWGHSAWEGSGRAPTFPSRPSCRVIDLVGRIAKPFGHRDATLCRRRYDFVHGNI